MLLISRCSRKFIRWYKVIINLHYFCPTDITKAEEIPVAQFYSIYIGDPDWTSVVTITITIISVIEHGHEPEMKQNKPQPKDNLKALLPYTEQFKAFFLFALFFYWCIVIVHNGRIWCYILVCAHDVII